MKIISYKSSDSQHDYYDSVAGYAFDNTVIYMRKQEEVKIDLDKIKLPMCDRPGSRPYGAHAHLEPEFFIIGFCGKIYPVVKFLTKQDKDNYGDYAFCFNIDDVDAFVKSDFSKQFFDKYMTKPTKGDWHNTINHHSFVKYFDDCDKQQDNFTSLFDRTPATPIWVVQTRRVYRWDKKDDVIVYNPILKNFQFQRRIDPFTAYQEIQMYLTNIAVPQKPMPVIPDEDKVATHGFDKYSFRKEKGKKK